MATNRFIGGASAVAQEDRFTPANVEIGDVFTLTATGEDGTTAAVSFTATEATVANVTAGLTAAWNASTHAFHTPVTASDQTTYIKLLADTAGVPFYVAGTTTDGGGANTQTLSRTATTANSGPNDWNTAANWSLGAVPVATNDVILENLTGVDILYGLCQQAVELASFKKDQSFTGKIAQAVYPRRLNSPTAEINYHDGTAMSGWSTRENYSFETTACTVNIYGSSASSVDSGLAPVRVKTDTAGSKIHVYKGIVGIGGNYEGETATVDTVSSLYTTSVANDVQVYIGSGVTLTTMNQTGGTVVQKCGCTTATILAGTFTKTGAGNITTVNNQGGTASLGGSGTIGTLTTGASAISYPTTAGTITTNNVYGLCDLTRSRTARTITTTNLYKASAVLKFDPDVITFTNKPVAASGQGNVSLSLGAA